VIKERVVLSLVLEKGARKDDPVVFGMSFLAALRRGG
jgi:hypothetical protein